MTSCSGLVVSLVVSMAIVQMVVVVVVAVVVAVNLEQEGRSVRPQRVNWTLWLPPSKLAGRWSPKQAGEKPAAE